MMKCITSLMTHWSTALFLSVLAGNAVAQERIEMETTTIKGNTELPKYLYVVPWQDKAQTKREEQKLVLHNLYGDLFDPVMPAYIPAEELSAPPTP